MRVVELANQIGISSQELRYELKQIDFGVKSTDRVIPDGIASGIFRVLRIKYKDRSPKINPEEKEVFSAEIAKEDKDEKDETKKNSKLVQTIDSIRFLKPAETKIVKPKPKHSPIASRKARLKKAVNYKPLQEGFKKIIIDIDTPDIASSALKRKSKSKTKSVLDEKVKKRVKITHKLTLDEVDKDSGVDISELEDARIADELEREIIKEQKKKKAKSKPIHKTKEEIEQVQIKEKSGVIELPEIITVKEFAEKTGIQVPKVITELIKNGIMATINQPIDFETAALIASELGVEVKKRVQELAIDDLISGNLAKLLEDEKSNLKTRPPIVTIMGHVDHGKTLLLDTIRKSNVIASEAGGITQHIGAYQIDYKKHKITFLDTPGHESFTAMRARGAKVTDITILVVAADEGMKPQTIEALNHAKDAKVPIIVALNKIDKENANIDMVKGQLAEHDLVPEDWGGKTIVVPISAKNNENIDQLLEMVLLVAEMEDLQANPKRPAIGTVIESYLDPSLGPVATILINTGTLKIMDSFVIGEIRGRIKRMVDSQNKKVVKAEPSAAIQIAGLDKVPQTGDILQVTKDEKTAKEKIQEILELKEARRQKGDSLIMQEIINKIQTGKLKVLKIVLKADTKGSLEAIQQSLAKIDSKKVIPKIIHAAVGGISESDIMMAAASKGIVIGFQVLANTHVQMIADQHGIKIKIYQVIYDLIEDVRKLLLGLVEPEIVETVTGTAQIKKIFFNKRKHYIVGALVTNGTIENGNKIKVYRGDEVIGIAEMTNLKIIKEKVKEVRKKEECGIELTTKLKLQEGDKLECFKEEVMEHCL